MSRSCDRLRRRLLENGTGAVRGDRAAEEHLVECAECFGLLEAMAALDGRLTELPSREPPAAWVEELLAQPELARPPSRMIEPDEEGRRDAWSWSTAFSKRLFRRLGALGHRWPRLSSAGSRLGRWLPSRTLRWGTAAAAVGLLLVVIVLPLRQRSPSSPVGNVGLFSTEEQVEASKERTVASPKQKDVRLPLREREPEPSPPAADPVAGGSPVAVVEEEIAVVTEAPMVDKFNVSVGAAVSAPEKKAQKLGVAELYGSRSFHSAVAARPGVHGEIETSRRAVARASKSQGRHQARWFGRALEPVPTPKAESNEAVAAGAEEELSDSKADDDRATSHSLGFRTSGEGQAAQNVALERARAFLDERQRLDGLVFQQASGYWRNTYLPADSALRLLDRRLRAHAAEDSQAPLLHLVSRRPLQPFDPPEDAALSVFLSADRRALGGRERLLVQVGLKATERRGAPRPARHLAVVADLRGELEPGLVAALRALLLALQQERDHADRFHLLLVSAAGVEHLTPLSFRHGPISVALEKALEQNAGDHGPDLVTVVAQAVTLLGESGDPSAVLGSSSLLLVTGARLKETTSIESLVDAAHRSAVGGIAVSVVALGEAPEIDEIDRVALAGQGSRYLLLDPENALALVERELEAVSRVVARAVRLRLRLAEGVRLVDVVDSEPLGEQQAERVRRAEQAVDLRLARDFGITADRGEDEEGIQIVIPTFEAGGEHVLLLDLVAEARSAATPIADVTVRFKDLVYPGNGVVRAHLSLSRRDLPPGPLERNVLKNLVAHELYRLLEGSSQEIRNGAIEAARAMLEEGRALVAGLRLLIPGWENDGELDRDLALLDGYLQALGGAGTGVGEEVLADSLAFAGQLKVRQPPPNPTELGNAAARTTEPLP